MDAFQGGFPPLPQRRSIACPQQRGRAAQHTRPCPAPSSLARGFIGHKQFPGAPRQPGAPPASLPASNTSTLGCSPKPASPCPWVCSLQGSEKKTFPESPAGWRPHPSPCPGGSSPSSYGAARSRGRKMRLCLRPCPGGVRPGSYLAVQQLRLRPPIAFDLIADAVEERYAVLLLVAAGKLPQHLPGLLCKGREEEGRVRLGLASGTPCSPPHPPPAAPPRAGCTLGTRPQHRVLMGAAAPLPPPGGAAPQSDPRLSSVRSLRIPRGTFGHVCTFHTWQAPRR